MIAEVRADREATASTGLGRISVIIANFNYAEFVGAAIDSALDLDWPDVEVIVVDDGSTDGSGDVIRGYGDRIQAVFQDNATQRVARNRGYELATGDAVIHLDSDDVLRPALARRVASVWRPGISKVQVQMERIDDRGDSTGSSFPRFRRTPDPQQIRRWAALTTAYPTPPGSGNVYAREFLDRLFPIDDRCGPATDSACLAAAPFLGDVVTIAEPLVGYRIHGSNTSNMMASDDKFARAVERARARHRYTGTLTTRVDGSDESPLFRSRPLLQLRVAAARLTPTERPIASDGRLRMVRDSVASAFHPGPESIAERVLIGGWCLLTLIAPQRLSRRLVRLRYGRQR